MLCVVCDGSLNGRQRRFCSRDCKNRFGNNRYQSYQAQQRRGRQRKLALVEMKGAKCERCGYNKNYAALSFHHVDSDTKEFSLDLRSLSNRTWDSLLNEAARCMLLCANCHLEVHNPRHAITGHECDPILK